MTETLTIKPRKISTASKLKRAGVTALAISALATGITVANTQAASAGTIGTVGNSRFSQRNLLVAKYWNGKGTIRILERGRTTGSYFASSLFNPRGCELTVTSGGRTIGHRYTVGWWNDILPRSTVVGEIRC